MTKTALVTGGSRGIGYAIAKGLFALDYGAAKAALNALTLVLSRALSRT